MTGMAIALQYRGVQTRVTENIVAERPTQAGAERMEMNEHIPSQLSRAGHHPNTGMLVLELHRLLIMFLASKQLAEMRTELAHDPGWLQQAPPHAQIRTAIPRLNISFVTGNAQPHFERQSIEVNAIPPLESMNIALAAAARLKVAI